MTEPTRARLPLIPMLLILLAAAGMVALGVWQLGRARWKEQLLVLYTANRGRPPIMFPMVGDDSYLFRRSSLTCLEVADWQVVAGRSRAGATGWRHLARCRTGIEGPGALVDLGWSAGFADKPAWGGGRLTGMIASKPDHRSLIESLSGKPAEPGLMLIAEQPAPGLQPSAFPAIAEIPNNHRAYAVQWFLFAGVALVIGGLAVRQRMRRQRGD